MTAIGLSGSPRKDGNTECLVREALKPFFEAGWETRELFCSALSIAPCRGCDACRPAGRCAIDDDMARVAEALEGADAFIVGSPAYYRGVPAQLKALFDRCYAHERRALFRNKPAGAIAVGRGQEGGQSIVLTQVYNFLLSCGAYCVAGELNGVTAVADKPGDILRDERRLRQARILGGNVLNAAGRS